MKIVASIQARMGSSRLPGKVLKEICGKPMLMWQVDRLRESRLLDDVVVATTMSESDDEIFEFCLENDISVYRGSENDVLMRISNMIEENNVDIHVECFGDSPFTDPQIIDEFVGYYLKNKDEIDYVSNSIKTTYPPGSEVVVYGGRVLLKANSIVPREDPLREHVSIHIHKHPEIFRCMNLTAPIHLNHPDLYMEVDTPEDFIVVKAIIEHFNNIGKHNYSLSEIIDFMLNNPDLVKKNQDVERRWKEFRE